MHRHFTATAFIIDSKKRTLLIHHKRLKRWLPPGGHIEPDEKPEDAARRECKEETGLDVEIIGADQEDLFAKNPEEGKMLSLPFTLLLENIPTCSYRGEEAHQHMDFVYIAHPLDESQKVKLAEEEAYEIKWFTKEEIEKLDHESEIFSNVKGYILNFL